MEYQTKSSPNKEYIAIDLLNAWKHIAGDKIQYVFQINTATEARYSLTIYMNRLIHIEPNSDQSTSLSKLVLASAYTKRTNNIDEILEKIQKGIADENN